MNVNILYWVDIQFALKLYLKKFDYYFECINLQHKSGIKINEVMHHSFCQLTGWVVHSETPLIYCWWLSDIDTLKYESLLTIWTHGQSSIKHTPLVSTAIIINILSYICYQQFMITICLNYNLCNIRKILSKFMFLS